MVLQAKHRSGITSGTGTAGWKKEIKKILKFCRTIGIQSQSPPINMNDKETLARHQLIS